MSTRRSWMRQSAVTALAAWAANPAAAAQPRVLGATGRLPVLAWEALAEAQPASKKLGAEVRFPAGIDKLDGRQVVLTGFMVPLEAKAEQTRYLLTAQPQDCEFCIEGGPSRYVEVHSAPLRFSSKQLTVAGRLVLLRNDPSGMFYRLVGAEKVAP